MHEKAGRLPQWEDILFTVETAQRKVCTLCPMRHLPGNHDRLEPGARSVVDHIELLGGCALSAGCRGAARRRCQAEGPDEEVERLRYSRSVGAVPLPSVARSRVSVSRLSASSRRTARRAACSRSGSGGALGGADMRGITVARA